MKKTTVFLFLLLLGMPLSAATIDDLAWMAGHWRSQTGDSSSEELWIAPEAGLMLGVHRDVRPNRRAFFEFLRIEERDGKIAYIAQPGGKPPTSFPLVSIEASKVTFENPDHDFPQRIIYWLDGNELCGRAEGMIDGKKQGDQWCWTAK